ncbi:hypothetical protein BOX17_13645 [Halomonas aestuarii]|uniref:2TM domain-containing protein n=1 Tax=Halomonas aestuarii TaxID=1897729 RepID=A0A1J0VIR5_9GAMM|nr:2TM domain-containing protein [Halomonas aestuarii]APE31905.1 hypothetical protein BOX17_13645 [Halomonas aestuarii]
MENQEAFNKAKKKVEAKIGFYIHLGIYVVVNIMLVAINLLTSSQYFWFKWPLIGWGIGVLLHGLGVFAFPGESAIKERMIKREMKKAGRKKH